MRRGKFHAAAAIGVGGSLDFHAAQQIGVNLVPRRGFGGVRPSIDRLDSHAFHQCRDMPTADGDSLAVQKIAEHASSG
jgi:hypothetical protein